MASFFLQMEEMIVMKKAYLTLLTVLANIYLFAQEKSTQVAVDVNKSSSSNSNSANWYASPWVWIVGAAIFILLLVALTSSGRSTDRTDRVIVKKTVTRDTDV